MDSENYLIELRDVFLKNNIKVNDLEMTSGNYDNNGNLIEEKIPTITTEFCEIGVHKDSIYFVFIIHSDSYNKKIFDLLKKFPNIQFYGFRDFKIILYPKPDFDYSEFEKAIEQDQYLQIQFDYQIGNILPESLSKEHNKIRDILGKYKIKIVDQT